MPECNWGLVLIVFMSWNCSLDEWIMCCKNTLQGQAKTKMRTSRELSALCIVDCKGSIYAPVKKVVKLKRNTIVMVEPMRKTMTKKKNLEFGTKNGSRMAELTPNYLYLRIGYLVELF